MRRRRFLKNMGKLGMAAAAGGALHAPQVWAKGRTIAWSMATSWPRGFPILQSGAEQFAELVGIMSDGRLKIEVYAANEKTNALEVHDAVSKQIVECASTTAFYWAKKVPAAQWFTSVPFGLKAPEMNIWYYEAGGRELWEEAYADYDLVPMLIGNTGIQMGGWFNREIRQPEDFSGLRMRIPGLGGQVVSRLGTQVVVLPAGEIVQALKAKTIDAAEWVGPYHDTLMGFPEIATYYYAPGWQEPGAAVELVVNRTAFEKLPPDLKVIVESAASLINHQSFSAFEFHNQEALSKIIAERKVKMRLFPHRVLRILERLSHDVLNDEANKDPMSLKIHTAYQQFQEKMRKFSLIRGADIRI